MEYNISFGFKCESAETHSTNATIAKGLQVWHNAILAKHNLSNATGNRNLIGGILANKEIISDIVGIFSPKAAQFVRPILVLADKVAKGEKMDAENTDANAPGEPADNAETPTTGNEEGNK